MSYEVDSVDSEIASYASSALIVTPAILEPSQLVIRLERLLFDGIFVAEGISTQPSLRLNIYTGHTLLQLPPDRNPVASIYL